MADTEKLLKQLQSLAHLDIDAVAAYNTAIGHIDLIDVKQQLTAFRGDHEQHVSDLAPWIERLGGKVPRRTPDLKGFIIQGFTAVRSLMGNEGALKAMKGNEEIANKAYAEALEQREMPADVRLVIEKNRTDELRHLNYIKDCIANRVWEHPEQKAA